MIRTESVIGGQAAPVILVRRLAQSSYCRLVTGYRSIRKSGR
jgi:hypothetical protein